MCKNEQYAQEDLHDTTDTSAHASYEVHVLL